jgi:hypothetical protein
VLLVVPAYLLRLLDDGRKLRSSMRSSPNGLAAEIADNEPRLVTPDYPAWMASPFEPSAGEAAAGDLRFSRRDL